VATEFSVALQNLGSLAVPDLHSAGFHGKRALIVASSVYMSCPLTILKRRLQAAQYEKAAVLM